MEMLVKMAAVLVKIAVMMMAPGSAPAPPEARGERPPSSSSSLTSSLDGRRVSPLVLGLHGVGGARDPPRLDLSLCFCVLRFCPSPFPLYLEIRNSDWGESFAQIFLRKLAFLWQKKSVNRLTGGPQGSGARPGGAPCLVATSGTVSR